MSAAHDHRCAMATTGDWGNPPRELGRIRVSRVRVALPALALAACLLPLAPAAPAAAVEGATSVVFINELHYDNAGTDEGEAVEVAGPAGTDLTGWQVVLYNGNGGGPYNTRTLSEAIPEQQNGYGTIFEAYPSNGIQNGAPDGLALVDASGEVVQFLSYEGVFTAVGGPADGMASTDIGVAQTGETPVSSSLYLEGTGSVASDFTWTEGEGSNTFGEPNAGQTFAQPDNAAPVATCPDDFSTPEGEAASRDVSAVDADGTVTAIELASVEPASEAFAVTDVAPAPGVGGTATATLAVDGTAGRGSYTATVRAVNDDPEPQSATCTVMVTVTFDGVTVISQIQGPGDSSPLDGQQVSIEAVVTSTLTGDDQGNQLGGVYVEEEAADRDDDARTSEGVFVFLGAQSAGAGVTTGDLVQVTGAVEERFGQTQIDASSGTIETVASDVGLPDPAVVTELPAFDEDRTPIFEPLEGMRVRLGGTWTVTENFDLHRFGELELVPGDRPLRNPTNVMDPGPEAGVLEAAARAKALSLTLDDTRDGELADNGFDAPYVDPETSGTIRRGSTADDQVGIMAYGFGRYRLRPVDTEDSLKFDYADRPEETPVVGGDVTVAAFNVLNYFNGNGDGTGFPTERGASTFAEFQRQTAKIVDALDRVDADVVGLMEIENDDTGEASAIDDLVTALNAASERTYAPVDTGAVGPDAIKVAFIYDTATVALDGFATLSQPPFPANSRVPVAARFSELATGEDFVPIVNHFKSKGGSGTGDNADQGDGQAAFNGDRVRAAQALLDWTETDGFFADDDAILVIGDLNAYANEDPIRVFDDAGYADLPEEFADGARAPYSYTFFGAEGRLDHALGNPAALAVTTGAAFWHVNADEPRGKDYTFFNQPELYQPDAFRSSDHDPVLVGLDLADPVEPVEADLGVAVDAHPPRGRGAPPVTFTVEVTNHAAGDVADVTVQHQADLPDGVTVKDVRLPGGTSFDGQALTWTIPTLGAGQSLELEIRFDKERSSSGDLTLAATVSAIGVTDPNPGNDTDSDTVTLRSPPGRP
ncbi:hypothetical protein BH20ACT8_BH20ACT8_08660 [soil metagenome]